MAAASQAVFVSYRRSDTAHAAGRMRDRLIKRFGRRSVFLDVDDIPAGSDFISTITRAAASCRVMLVLIDERWAAAADRHGRRLDQPDDVVALEIVTALRSGVRVIPVLMDGAKMPGVADLPSHLRQLVHRNAHPVKHETFERDVTPLLDEIGDLLPRPDHRRRELLGIVVGMLLAVAGVATLLFLRGGEGQATTGGATASTSAVGAPTGLLLVDAGHGGGGNQEQYYSATWRQPDLHGAELVEYRVTQTSVKTGELDGSYNTRDTGGVQVGGYRCLMPFQIEVRAVYRTPGTTDEVVSPPATTLTDNYDCSVAMSVGATATGPDSLTYTLTKLGPSIEVAPSNCTLLMNGAVIKQGQCESEPAPVEVTGLQPSTDYTLSLEITSPYSPKTSSNTVTVSTPTN